MSRRKENTIPEPSTLEEFQPTMMTDLKDIAKKFPSHQNPDHILLENFIQLPVNAITPFKRKNQNDFSPLDDDTYRLLVESIAEHGVLDPIIVRREESNGTFELLSGEHRWKACQQLRKTHIPAKIMTNCSDEDATGIFIFSNLARRTLTFQDKIYGWWRIEQLTFNKRATTIAKLIEEGVVKESDITLSKRQQKRYASLYYLIPELQDLVEQKKLSLENGALLSKIEKEKQKDLVEYVRDKRIHRDSHIIELQKLANCEEEDSWTIANIERILEDRLQNPNLYPSFTASIGQAKYCIKEILPKHLYGEMEIILREALTLYANQYPEKEFNI